MPPFQARNIHSSAKPWPLVPRAAGRGHYPTRLLHSHGPSMPSKPSDIPVLCISTSRFHGRFTLAIISRVVLPRINVNTTKKNQYHFPLFSFAIDLVLRGVHCHRPSPATHALLFDPHLDIRSRPKYSFNSITQDIESYLKKLEGLSTSRKSYPLLKSSPIQAISIRATHVHLKVLIPTKTHAYV